MYGSTVHRGHLRLGFNPAELGQKMNACGTVSYTSKSDREASDKQGNYKRVVPMRECTEHKRGYKAEMCLYTKPRHGWISKYEAQAWMNLCKA